MKKIASILLSISIICGVILPIKNILTVDIPYVKAEEITTIQSGMTLEHLRMTTDGRYWNHVVSGSTTYADYLMNSRLNTYAYTFSNHPCANHGIAAPKVGTYDCNAYNGKVQCRGFAFMLADLIYGGNADTWDAGNLEEIKTGDILTYWSTVEKVDATYGHTVFVIGKSNEKITVAEANYGNVCQVKWGWEIEISTLKNTVVKSAPKDLEEAFVKIGDMSVTPSKFTYNTSEKVIINWTTAENATSYGLTVRNSSGEDVLDKSGLTGTSYTVGKLTKGSYTVWMRPYGENGTQGNNAKATFTVETIQKINDMPTVKVSNVEKSYTGKAYSISVKTSGKYADSTVITYSMKKNGTYTAKKPTRTAVGTTTVYFKAANPYYSKTQSGFAKITVTKGKQSVSVKSYTGSYDGESHSVTVKGAYKGSTVYYRTSKVAKWRTSKPTRKKVGTTTVYVKVTNKNCSDWTGKGTIKISKEKEGNALTNGYYCVSVQAGGLLDVTAETDCDVSFWNGSRWAYHKKYKIGEKIQDNIWYGTDKTLYISVYSGKILVAKTDSRTENKLAYSIVNAEHDIFYGFHVSAGETLVIDNQEYNGNITYNDIQVLFSGNCEGKRLNTSYWWHTYNPNKYEVSKPSEYDLSTYTYGSFSIGSNNIEEIGVTSGSIDIYVFWADKDKLVFSKR